MRKTIKPCIESHKRPFCWRTNNCVHSMAEVIDHYHGVNCINVFGFEFGDTKRENLTRLRKKGYQSLLQLIGAHMDVKDKNYAKSGDICFSTDPHCIGIYQYDSAVFWGENGLLSIPRKEVHLVYDLESYHVKAD